MSNFFMQSYCVKPRKKQMRDIFTFNILSKLLEIHSEFN